MKPKYTYNWEKQGWERKCKGFLNPGVYCGCKECMLYKIQTEAQMHIWVCHENRIKENTSFFKNLDIFGWL